MNCVAVDLFCGIFIDVDHPQTNRQIGVHIGNAVPVKLGEAIGKSILAHLVNVKR